MVDLTKEVNPFDHTIPPTDDPATNPDHLYNTPAGYQRDEENARRIDAMQEKIDKILLHLEVESINPQAFEKDRELQHTLDKYYDAVSVSNAQPERYYCWVFTGLNGQKIWEKKAQSWQIVQGNDPECTEFKAEDTSRRFGDTMLMWIRFDAHAKYIMRENEKRRRQQFGVESELMEMGAKYRDKGIIVHTNADSKAASGGQIFGSGQRSNVTSDIPNQSSLVRQHGRQMVNDMLRHGTVPGMQVQGRKMT